MQLRGDFHGRGACRSLWTMGLKLDPSRLRSNLAPLFLPKKNPPALDQSWGEKLKVDLFKACLSDTFLGFITFRWEVFISAKFGDGEAISTSVKRPTGEYLFLLTIFICHCCLNISATFVWLCDNMYICMFVYLKVNRRIFVFADDLYLPLLFCCLDNAVSPGAIQPNGIQDISRFQIS